MPLKPLDYSGPLTHSGQVSTSRSIVVGIICWDAIVLAGALAFLAGGTFAGSVAAIFLMIGETILALYGLLAGCIDCHLVRPLWWGVVGVALNLTALAPAVVFIISIATH